MRRQPRGASTVTSFIGILFGVRAGHGMGYAKWLELPTYWLDISSLHRHGRRQLGARCSTTAAACTLSVEVAKLTRLSMSSAEVKSCRIRVLQLRVKKTISLCSIV
jgi:hypothetical protein